MKGGFNPSLDWLSFFGHAPLHTGQISITDVENSVKWTEFICPHPPFAFSGHESFRQSRTMAPVYAMYREAMNATSPFYRFFCLYKILEGLLNRLRNLIYTEAKRSGITLQPFKPLVPDLDDLPAQYKDFVGRSIQYFFDTHLTKRYRTAVAHFVTDSDAVLHVSHRKDIAQFNEVIRITDVCCREVMSQLGEQCLVLDRK